ncbi:hypothetical protein [Streptomyces sp. NPDC048419]|uniref:hypothetical protein n=1 Tax=Streptomyces sp. NPDC048419 TaxID=3365547 RepID=UPI00371AA913
MPTGYAETSSSDSSDLKTDDVICQRLLDTLRARPSTSAGESGDAEFEKSTSGPFVASSVVAFTGSGAEDAMASVRDFAQKCPQFTSKVDGTDVSFTAGLLSIPAYGDESAAMRFTGAVDSVTVGVNFLLIRVGSAVTAVEVADLGTPDVDLTQQMAARAAAKLRQVEAGETPTSSPPPSS